MSRIAFVADPHIGNHKKNGGPLTAGINWRCGLSLGALELAVDKAMEREVDAFVVLGDLNDYSLMEAPILRREQEILGPPPLTVLLVGNHDLVSSEPGNHAMAPLAEVAEVIETTTVLPVKDVDLIVVPFQPGPAKKWLPAEVTWGAEQCRPDSTRVLCIHLGVSDDKTPYYLDGADDSISASALDDLCFKLGIRYVFAGNWHRHQTWSFAHVVDDHIVPVDVMQVGTLAPNRFTDDGIVDFGALATLKTGPDGSGATCITIPGPRFLYANGLAKLKKFAGYAATSDSDPIKREQARAAGAEHIFFKVTLRAGEWEEGMEIVRALPSWVTAEAEGDTAEAKAQAKEAGARARASSTMDGAIKSYVDTMPLPDGVERGEVHRRAKGYLT